MKQKLISSMWQFVNKYLKDTKLDILYYLAVLHCSKAIYGN